MNINGKNAIVTGGGRGLGKAVALALANEGVHVAVTGRNEENLKKYSGRNQSAWSKFCLCGFQY